jgi:hypothetical protein
MKTRLILALTFACALGASAYYTSKTPAPSTQLSDRCCDGNPEGVIIAPIPAPTPTPQPGS